MKTKQRQYQTLTEIVHEMADILRPPERLTVSQAAAKYRYLNNPGSFVGYWDNSFARYLVEPMDLLTSREFGAVVFVGPAQSGKTELWLNWQAYTIICDPSDMVLYEKSQTTARDFSRRRVDKMHRHSPAVGNRMIQRRDADNTFDKIYKSGAMVTLSWPAINELSGRPVPRVGLTDYDRMPMNVDKEGSPFDLARKRTTTFRSFAKTLAESSPGFTVMDTKTVPKTPHEAPPCEGILSLYNRGDRRRFYWPCPHCEQYFEGDFDLLDWPDSNDLVECAEAAFMMCPHCYTQHGIPIEHGMKNELNNSGIWVPDGMRVLKNGTLTGQAYRSDIASFWLKGTAAAFATWKTLVLNYLKAMQEYERTGSEESLKSTINTDQGKPYVPKSMESERLPEDIKARKEDLGQKVVPIGVRFLVPTIDVQKNRWVVQVHGVGKGGDLWVIDRYEIIKSERRDDDGERLWVKPATYLEDWELLVENVLEKTYPLGDDSGRHMQVKVLGCDSGGKAGVTYNAYNFWRKLRDEGEGKHKRFILVKGEPNDAAPRSRVSYPDSGQKSKAAARGDVPVLMLNSNVLKDRLNAMIDRTKEGGGLIHYADWLPDEFYTELTVEQKTHKGWENLRGLRNEAWDLLYYVLGICHHLRTEHINWDAAPGWAEEWDKNDLVFTPIEDQPKFAPSTKSGYDLKALASKLA